MFSLKFSIIFVFLVSLSSSLSPFTSAADRVYSPLYHICSDKNFTRNSTYEANLNSLLSSLTSDAKRNQAFNMTTKGQNPYQVYGRFQCRGDVNTTTCQDCVASASREATRRCPNNKEATMWYDECSLRFSDSYFFYATDLRQPHTTGIVMWVPHNISVEPSRFHEILMNMMNLAASQAAEDPKKFATIKRNLPSFQTICGLVQCTQDLWVTDCQECLKNAIANMPTESIGARLLLPTCISRYEMYQFYNENLTASPPSPSPPSPETRPKGKRQISSSTITAIVAPITVVVVLFVTGYCFLTRRAKRKYKTSEEEIGKFE